MKRYKNIIFDLGGVVVARDATVCTKEFLKFFEYIHYKPMPTFWSEYDKGTVLFDDMVVALAKYRGVTTEHCESWVARTITMQDEVLPTKELVIALKNAGYRLYILSNMAREYIEHIRTLDVYSYFDGEVISSEEGCVKPDTEIYKILLSRYNLNPAESLFIDDREENIVTAKTLNINGILFNANAPHESCSCLAEDLL